MKKFFVFLGVSCFLTPLYGVSITNQELLLACQDNSPGARNFCFGFIISAANAAQFYRNIVDIEDQFIDICMPDEISNKEVVDLYIAWAKDHMELAKSPAFLGVSTSFSKKYSCPPEQKDKKPSVVF